MIRTTVLVKRRNPAVISIIPTIKRSIPVVMLFNAPFALPAPEYNGEPPKVDVNAFHALCPNDIDIPAVFATGIERERASGGVSLVTIELISSLFGNAL